MTEQVDLDPRSAPGILVPESERESGLGLVAFTLSMMLVVMFAFIVFYPATAAGDDDWFTEEDIFSGLVFLYLWLPLFGLDCLLTIGALLSGGHERKHLAVVAGVVNAVFVFLLAFLFIYATTN